MSKSSRPGVVLTLVALVSGLVDLAFGLYLAAAGLFDAGSNGSMAVIIGGGALGLAVLAALAIEQSARSHRLMAWLLVIPPCLVAHALLVH